MSSTDQDFWNSLRRDCRQFHSERPCTPHKERGVLCADCEDYDRVEQRIVLVKLAATGDVLRTTSFLPGLRRLYPAARLRWLTMAAALPLLEGNSFLDEVLETDGQTLPATLQMQPQDLVLCPDSDPQTAALAAQIPLRPGGRRIGFGLDADGCVEPLSEAALRWYLLGVSDQRKRANRETYQNLVGAVLELPQPVLDRPQLTLLDSEQERGRAWFENARRPHASLETWIGVVTGAGSRWPRKQWTLEGQIAFVRETLARGRGVILYGGPEEVERHDALRAALLAGASSDAAIVDAGTDNTLREFAAKLDCCDAVLTGDTMAMHVALAFEKPVVALFGPTSSAEIEMYGKGVKVFAENLDCLCCYATCDRHPSCMDLVSAPQVLAALESLLEN